MSSAELMKEGLENEPQNLTLRAGMSSVSSTFAFYTVTHNSPLPPSPTWEQSFGSWLPVPFCRLEPLARDWKAGVREKPCSHFAPTASQLTVTFYNHLSLENLFSLFLFSSPSNMFVTDASNSILSTWNTWSDF